MRTASKQHVDPLLSLRRNRIAKRGTGAVAGMNAPHGLGDRMENSEEWSKRGRELAKSSIEAIYDAAQRRLTGPAQNIVLRLRGGLW